jgi:hypothetical protein
VKVEAHLMPLVLKAYITLFRFEYYLKRADFSGLYNAVRNCAISAHQPKRDLVQPICFAVDVACIWYWKEVLCLQRSAAASFLLKRHGIPAQLVIGSQQIPFKVHAWVEVGGSVVNDKAYIRDTYSVLEKC